MKGRKDEGVSVGIYLGERVLVDESAEVNRPAQAESVGLADECPIFWPFSHHLELNVWDFFARKREGLKQKLHPLHLDETANVQEAAATGRSLTPDVQSGSSIGRRIERPEQAVLGHAQIR
jgi:hypothetical protein